MLLPSSEQALADLRLVGVDATSAMVAALFRYANLLGQWQARINLVGPKTLATVWRRHILDSAQLGPQIPASAKTLTDIGSGAGFPALVLAILYPHLRINCVESDTRKCAFLMAVVRDLHLNVTVLNQRLEVYDWRDVDVVTARALASLAALTPALLVAQAANPAVAAILPKGAQAAAEMKDAPDLTRLFHVKQVPSLTDPAATLLVLSSPE